MNSRLVAGVTAAVLSGVLVVACSSGSSTSATTHSPVSTGSSSTGSTSSAPSASSSSSTSSTAGGLSRCATAGLVGSPSGGSGAAGTIETTVALKNTASSTCVLDGYPGLQLLNAGGASLPTTVVRKGSYSFTSMSPVTVTLAMGQSAHFNIGYSDVPVGSETSCPTSARLEITPPNAVDHLVMAAMLSPCGGGTLVVSPVY